MSVFIARFGDISAHFCATSMQDGSISGSTRSSPNNPLAFLIIAHSFTPSIPPSSRLFVKTLQTLSSLIFPQSEIIFGQFSVKAPEFNVCKTLLPVEVVSCSRWNGFPLFGSLYPVSILPSLQWQQGGKLTLRKMSSSLGCFFLLLHLQMFSRL